MTSLEVDVDLKMLRETLCMAQTGAVMDPYRTEKAKSHHVARLQALIDAVDVHRPLGSDGKHGNLHTATCGCDDVDGGIPALQQLANGLRKIFPGASMRVNVDVLTLTLGELVVMADDWNTKVDAIEQAVQKCSGEAIYVSVESCTDVGQHGRVFRFRQHNRD